MAYRIFPFTLSNSVAKQDPSPQRPVFRWDTTMWRVQDNTTVIIRSQTKVSSTDNDSRLRLAVSNTRRYLYFPGRLWLIHWFIWFWLFLHFWKCLVGIVGSARDVVWEYRIETWEHKCIMLSRSMIYMGRFSHPGYWKAITSYTQLDIAGSTRGDWKFYCCQWLYKIANDLMGISKSEHAQYKWVAYITLFVHLPSSSVWMLHMHSPQTSPITYDMYRDSLQQEMDLKICLVKKDTVDYFAAKHSVCHVANTAVL